MDIISYVLSRKYTQDTAIGLGAVKGANCTIKSTEETAQGNKITFEWTATDGTKKTKTLLIKDAPTINEVQTVKVGNKWYFKFVFVDGNSIMGGEVPTDPPKLKQKLVATNTIGSVTSGKTYEVGTDLEAIIRDILIKVENPSVVLTLQPNKTLYDIVEEEITTITLSAKVTKKTYPTTILKYYVDGVVVETKTATTDGTYNFIYNPSTPIKETTEFKVVVEDEKGNLGTSKVETVFVAKSYYGIVADNIGEPTEAQVKALNSVLKNTNKYVYENIVATYNKVVYAYPKELGALSSIRDMINNLNYTNSFTKTELKIDNIDYLCYTQTNPSGADGVELTFA